MLGQTPSLVHPQAGGESILDTDVSIDCTGVLLPQVQEGQEKIIAFESKMFTKTEGNYCITR